MRGFKCQLEQPVASDLTSASVCVCVMWLQRGGPELMCVLSSDLSEHQMGKRLIYPSMAATGFCSARQRWDV